MKAKQYRFKSYPIFLVFLLLSFTIGLTSANAQCPTVTNTSQTLCDIQSVLVGDLQAIDNGGGIVWYESAISTVPLSNSDNLISGEDYYADDNTGTCSPRARVDITIYVAPVGDNFQGICVSDSSLATVSDLVATGNDVQWYLTASGGIPLNDSDLLIDNTIYYADQASPDGSCRTSRLSVLVNVGLTPTPTGDMIQEFCASTDFTPTVNDLVASGNNNWYISLFSAFPLPTNTPLINGQTYYATSLDPPCESIGRLIVIAILETGPNAGDDGILDLCENNTSTVNLFDSLGGSPDSGGIWSPALNSGTGVYDPSIDPAVEYTYTVSSNNSCPDESATVNVTIIPEPNAGTDGTLDICSNSDAIDLFTFLGGTPETGGTWSPALTSGTGIFNPAVDAQTLYTYTVTGTTPCIDTSATVNVSVATFRDAGENGTISICDSDSTIDLFDSLGGTPDTGGTWSPALNSGTGIFDPSIDNTDVYTYSFIGIAPCPDESSTVTVTVNPLPNAGSDATLEICSNDLATVDLFDSLGGSPEIGGTWSPALTSGTGVFDPNIDMAGVYTYNLIGTAPCPNALAEVNVLIIQEPNAGIDATIDICSNNGTIDLYDNLEGFPEVGGTWSPTLASGTGIFDPEIDAIGDYTYTVIGTSPCANASATMTIFVTPFQSAGTDGSITVCTDDGTVDLFNSLSGTPETGGTWSPALNSGTGIFDPNVDAEDIYTYTTSGIGPCSNDSATVDVTVEIAPDAGIDGTLTLCNINNTADLFNSLGGTPQLGGSWLPALSSGTGVFNPNTDPDGTYSYTINSICGDVSATVTVSVIDANDAGTNGAIELCANDAAIDLFDSLGGTPDTVGTWSPTLTSGTGIFDPSLDSGETYTYTVSNSSTLCPDDSATVTVSLLLAPDAGNDGTLNLCNTSNTVDLFNSLAGTPETGGTWTPSLSSGTGVFDPNSDPEGTYTYTLSNSCGNNSATVAVSLSDSNDAGTNGTIELCESNATIDLFDILGGTPDVGGTWSPTLISGTGIFDPSSDTSGIYTYTVSNSATLCPNDSATVTITLLQGPDAGNDGTLNLCNSTNTVDLFNSLAGTPEIGGTWTPTLTSATGIFDPNIDTEGVYTYTLNNTCGNSSATVTVSFSNLNDAGTDGAITLCSTDASVDLFDSLVGTPQVGGTWSPTLTSGTGIFNPSLDTPNTYTYTVSNNASNCPDASATVTVSLLQVPDAGNDGTLNLCNSTVSVDLFNSLSGTPEVGGSWSPALTSGTGMFDPNIDLEGTYTYTLNNSCGNSSATVTVSYSDLNDAGTNGSIILCSTDAAVDLFDSLGGTPQVGGTWSPELTSNTGMFDPSIDSANTYTYTISNSTSNCPDASASVVVTIEQSPDAGNDGTLNLCNSTNSVDLFDSLAGTPEAGGTWSPTLTSGTGIFDPNIDPEGSYTYTLNNLCGNSSATVIVSLSNLNDAGSDGTLELCSTSTTVDLFNSLGGTPDVGGIWTPTLNSGTGIFDPSMDAAGTYTYTISNNISSCPDASAIVTVLILQEPNAGNDGTLNLCESNSSVDLFDSLTGGPEAGGTWSPILTSGTGIFDPSSDPEGIYTYTLNNSCGNSFSTVTVSLSDLNDAGTDGSIELCSTGVAIDLFNSLGGTPDTGGTWSPTLTSGTGIFDPSTDAAGTYTYTIISSSICPDASSNVEVTFGEVPNTGTNGTLDLCSSSADSVDLFDSLGGTPDAGGIWSPTLTSGTGMFDPTVDTAAVYTYTLNNSCGNSSATVTVTISAANDAGSDGTIEFCSNAAAVDLFDSLGGTPDTGGIWSPTLTSGTGQFDPTTDTAGIYTYSISNEASACPGATASITVTIIPLPNAGNDAALNLCIDTTDSVNLFDSLGGTPETGGIWSPALTSGTGVFNPTIDADGIYTYTLTSTECNLTNSASVTVTILDLPDVTGLTMEVEENNVVCIGLEDAIINITGANQLPNGAYSIVYQLTGSNVSVNTVAITIAGGSATFIIPQTLLENPGETLVTLSQLFVLGQTCSALTNSVFPIKILVEDVLTPQLIDNGSEFCLEEISTIEDLSNNVGSESGTIIWYDQPIDGIAYDNAEVLQEGVIYYGAIRSAYGCESYVRLEVSISFIECIGDLLIPDGFSPNDDGINDVFDILFLNDLYPNFKLSIYNRYGNILYEGDITSTQWDGTWKNKNTILPAGVYFYIIEFNDGETEPKQGRVYLNR